jgi:hypothetical protein
MPKRDTTLVSMEEYLSSSYEPDCDYVDGVLEERNLGEYDHGNLQTISAYLKYRARSWNVAEDLLEAPPVSIRISELMAELD